MKTLCSANLVIVVAFFVAATARAAVISVTTTADSGPGSLRAALAEAADGDTIDATGVSGTILLTSGELLVTNSISIFGPGPAVLAVDGNAASRVFDVTNVAAATISGLTVTNGLAPHARPYFAGGGIYNDNSTLTVSNCTISGDSAISPPYLGDGGGIFSLNSTLTFLDSVINSNSAYFGGGIYSKSSTLTVTNCSFSGNLAGSHGGGLYSLGSNTMVSVAKSVFTGNTSDYGSGIFSDSVDSANAMLSVSECTISFNTVIQDGGGGGLCTTCGGNGTSLVWVSHCTISSNTAEGGGGIDNVPSGGSMLWVSNCTIIGNVSPYAGGGIYSDGAPVMVANCVISGNSVGTYGSGGGIYTYGGALTVINSAIDDNTAGSVFGGGGGVYSEMPNDEAVVTFVDSSVSGNSAGYGGGIYNDGWGTGTLLVSNCTVNFNTASTGGGMANYWYIGSSVLAIAGSTIASNTAPLSSNRLLAGGVGGGIYNFAGDDQAPYYQTASAEVDIINSTLSGNAAGQSGSALYNLSTFFGTGTVQVANSTLSGNLTPDGGADIQNSGATFIGSTILNPGGSSLSVSNRLGTVTSLGFNLCSDDGGGLLTNATDLLNMDPLLGPLQDNGGPTFTQALLPGSPAVDQGKNFSGSLYDQRGYIRTFDDPLVPNAPGGDGTDIGAFEAQKSLLTPAQAVQRMLELVNSQWTRPQPLRTTLDAALAPINQGNPSIAVNYLRAFQNQVRAQVAGTDPALSQTLLLGSQGIIETLMEMEGSP